MKIEITSIREKIAGVEVQVGLSFRVFLSSDSVSDAIESAKSFTDGIVSFLTLVTGKGMETPREEIAYEITPNKLERDFRGNLRYSS